MKPEDFVPFVAGVMVTLMVAFFLYVAYDMGRLNWNLDQRNFPCAEDEVLGYAPRSTAHVVCIHIDDLGPKYGPAY